MLVKSLIHDLRGDASNNFNVNFFSVSGSAVGNKYRGESEKVLRAVFDVARTHRASPTSSEGGEEGPAISIVLLDEVDSLFGDATNASSDESSLRLKTTLLTHLDGVAGAGGEGENKVVVVGTTNLPFSLAEALLRRFNKRILIDLPTPADRASIISGCLSGVAVSPAVSPAAIAERTEGWSGSDLTTLCRDIAMNPMRRYFERYDSVREIDEYNKRLVRDGLGGIAVEDIGEVTDADVQLALERVKPASKAGVEECIRFAESFGSG
jgi:katanin p60 ATPase-containing subunit A1